MGQPKPYEHDLDQAYLANILPEGPGVYLFKDSRGKTLYVGKAKNLRKRVLSYFRARGTSCSKTLFMLKKASGLDFILTSNEKEAFILESTLIKRYKPRYNIVLRDDSQYPCLRLSLEEPFPRLTIVRKIKRDGARYFGPFSSASAVRNTLKVIDRIFQLRKCKTSALPKRSRPCLNYQMDRCLAPCSGKISEAEYGRVVKQVILFLEGKSEELISHLAQEMKDASARLEFERAARLRDQITSVQKTIERQQVVSPGMEDLDVIGIAQREDSFQLVVMYIREGRLIGIRNYRVKSPGHSPSEVMEAFIKQYYSRDLFLPGEIILSTPIEEAMAISAWLTDCAAKKVSIKVPKRGTKKRLTEMAVANAESLLSSADLPEPDRLIALIKERLGLTRPPVRIEGLDVSTLYGSKAVGAIVSFVNGKPYKAGYRNFKIKWADGMDDYGMLAEVVARRIALGDLPDLFLVDGGKGQLAVLERVVKEHVGKTSPQLAAIAKADKKKGERADKVFVQGRQNPISLSPKDPVLMLLMRIRDEAHRRAITYHRKLQKAEISTSILDQIPGVGPTRKRALLTHFKDLDSLFKASEEELASVKGITARVAREIRHFFNELEGSPTRPIK